MTITILSGLSRADWLSERASVITSTEVAALFGLSPYETEFELWHRKKDGGLGEIEENERMKWGNRLQEAIARGLAGDEQLSLSPAEGTFYVDRDLGIGASFDYFLDGTDSGMEIKNVDSLAFKQGWAIGGDGEVEAPSHIEMQVQQQMMLRGANEWLIGCLVGGNEGKVLRRKADKSVQRAIADKVREFWQSIRDNKPPTPDYVKDAETLRALYANASDGKLLRADNGTEIASLTAQLAEAKAQLKKWEDTETALRSQLLMQIGDAAKVVTPYGTISCGTTKPNPGKIVTQDMVGTYTGARDGFRQFRFYPAKEGK